jgi:FixJ family two-component response regulator
MNNYVTITIQNATTQQQQQQQEAALTKTIRTVTAQLTERCGIFF